MQKFLILFFLRRKFSFFNIYALAVFFSLIGLSKGQLKCEKIENFSWKKIGSLETCYMDQVTSIVEHNRSIDLVFYDSWGRLRYVSWGLNIGNNKKIRLLPILNLQYSDLVAYDAHNCSLTSISKSNFNNMWKLKYLALQDNHLEKIATDTFVGLSALEVLDMSKTILTTFYVFYFFFFIRQQQNKIHERRNLHAEGKH